MYYIIENGKITGSADTYLSSENGITIQKDFTQEELKKINSGYSYNIETGEFEETEESRAFKKNELQNEFETTTNDLVNVNGKIEGAKRLQEMGIFDEDDEDELVGYQAIAHNLINKRAQIKIELKSL